MRSPHPHTAAGGAPSSTVRRRRARAVAVAALALALAACGSQLDPETVGAASSGSSTSGEVGGSDAPGATDGGTVDAPSLGDGGDTPGSAGTGGTGGGATGSTGGDTAAPTSPEVPSGAPTTGENAADGGAKAASCDGFPTNLPGVTADTITLGNVSDVQGPVPGIFESSRLAARAYVNYFNATSDVCGRKLKLVELDSRADAGADQQAYATLCDDAFGSVGSMSAFDSGGAATASGCGLPDVRSTTVNPERSKCATCFSAQSVNPGQVPTAWPSWFAKNKKSAAQNAAILYIDAGAAPVNAASFRAGYSKSGWNVKVFRGIGVAEFNFVPYVQEMKEKGVQLVYYVGPLENTVKLQNAMAQQNFEPEVYVQDSTIYSDAYIAQAGERAKGTYVYASTAMFSDTSNKEMQLYLSWLNQVSPGSAPNFYGVYSWSATRLFVQEMVKLGANLSRESMVSALKKVSNWTGNDIHSPQDVGGKTTGKCQAVLQYTGSAWKKITPNDYICGSLVSTGIGG
ncbi:ABC transporter substrate-binding protein [Nocardioides sp. R-C-SC26]|uniref:ABC transporter substrate-binding protein n=1 Tax=Nocardioides sp. R-C-SC26 TaxID=2870414 RepID=UPI001E43C72E|nr:ABC transporter substrate-binding protein [Nocardioides sp. R-C-SC26]